MSKTYKHQNTYDYLHDNRVLPRKSLYKVLHWFDRLNFWDWDLKILARKHKDYVRGGAARVKKTKYK